MNGTDDYEFNCIPSGMKSTKGTFSRYGNDFFFWCSLGDYREDVDNRYLNGIRRALRNSEASIVRQGSFKLGGYVVRCVRDVE